MGIMKHSFMDWFENHEQELHEKFVESTPEIKEQWEAFVGEEHVSYISGDEDAQYEMMRDLEFERSLREPDE